jgi:hypothetical protein
VVSDRILGDCANAKSYEAVPLRMTLSAPESTLSAVENLPR